jgi:vesicle-fusing ATPase
MWQEALPGPVSTEVSAAAADVAQHYRLGTRSIRAVAGEWGALRGTADDLRRLARERARVSLGILAERIEPRAGWDDLVLPEGQVAMLRDLVTQVRHRATVYEDWGFAETSNRGFGVTALFTGESGTGKTMAAEVIADDLALDLFRIDLSAVVSKYIGETEKNLRSLFDAAEAGGAVLLFDEADALFGKRSDVKDSHDRYANLEVAYLLQRMEAYRGLAILTTNLRSNVDRAFLRRLRFVVQFPFPDDQLRQRIWARAFPPDTPTEGLDPAALGRMQVSGGSIRSIALGAAFGAAGAGTPVRPEHVLHAASVEYAKAERTLTAAETRGIGGHR